MAAKKPAAKKATSAASAPKIPELEPIEPARTRVSIDIEIYYERLADDDQQLEDVADELHSLVMDAVVNRFDRAIRGTLRIFVIRSAETPA